MDNQGNDMSAENNWWIYAEGICNECGQDHGFRRTYDDVKTSIDVLNELLIKAMEVSVFSK
jgi:hypothetical protein